MLDKTSLTREGYTFWNNRVVSFKVSFVGSFFCDFSVFFYVTFVISRVVDFNVLMKFLKGSASREEPHLFNLLNSSKEVRKKE